MMGVDDHIGSKPRQVSLVFSVCAVLVMSLCGCAGDSSPAQLSLLEPENPVVVDCSDADACHNLLDCSGGNACVTREVMFDVVACAETEKQARCDNFAKRLPTVNLISDAYNFISAPFTGESFDAELITSVLGANFDLEFLPDDTMLVTQSVPCIQLYST